MHAPIGVQQATGRVELERIPLVTAGCQFAMFKSRPPIKSKRALYFTSTVLGR